MPESAAVAMSISHRFPAASWAKSTDQDPCPTACAARRAIAALGDQHFLIEKAEQGGRTQTGVRKMEIEERRREIARMLGGAAVTETSLRHAKSLLEASR